MKITAETRTVVRSTHAVITPDGYVNSGLPGWEDCQINVLISPEMGARFIQQLITLGPQSKGLGQTKTSEIFFFVIQGSCQINTGAETHKLQAGSYLFVPPQNQYEVHEAQPETQLLTFQKSYVPLEGHAGPEVVSGNLAGLTPEMYMDDPLLHMQYLLPDDLSFDMAINVFTYQPGGNLPFVETHVMEHGVIYLAGEGIYRLDEEWYPVKKGDSIWMAPYCPQWFVAMGKEPAVYLYYKDVNRSNLGGG